MTFAEEDGTVLYCTVRVMVLVRYGLEAESFISLGGYIRVFSSPILLTRAWEGGGGGFNLGCFL